MLGTSLADVRVHAGADGARATAAASARAAAYGRDLYFRPSDARLGSPDTDALVMHEVAHAVQQGVGSGGPLRPSLALQGKGRKDAGPKAEGAMPENVFAEIKARVPELADMVTPESIAGKKAAPPLKTTKGTEDHEWQVEIVQDPTGGGSSASNVVTRTVTRRKKTIVQHTVRITWKYNFSFDPKNPDPSYEAQAKADAAKRKGKALRARSALRQMEELTITEPLLHELAHARIQFESHPDWTGAHTKLFADFQTMMAAGTKAAAERTKVRDRIVNMALKGTVDAADASDFADRMTDFLLHEKYDGQTIFAAMGKPASAAANDFVAKRYAEVVRRTAGLGKKDFAEENALAQAATKWFDAVDKNLAAQTPPAATLPAKDALPKEK